MATVGRGGVAAVAAAGVTAAVAWRDEDCAATAVRLCFNNGGVVAAAA